MTNKSQALFGAVGLAMVLLAGSMSAEARDRQRQRGAERPRATQPHTRTTERQRTEDGHTRTDTVTDANGRTRTREAVVTNDREAGTRTRNVDYTGPDGNTASVDSVRTRTDDGYTRDTTRTTPNDVTLTREVDVSCDKEANKCVKQVEVDKQP